MLGSGGNPRNSHEDEDEDEMEQENPKPSGMDSEGIIRL